MKKVFLIFFASFAILFLFSTIIYADGLVPCGTGSPTNPDGTINSYWRRCELKDLFTLALNVYNFIVLKIATPLAGLLIVIGGVLIMISGGPGGKNPVTGVVSPNLYTTAKNMIKGAAIGIFLIFGSWLIINIVLTAIGYNPPFPWSSLPF